MKCQYCERFCKNANSLRNHERLCKNNSNAQIIKSNFISYNEKIKTGEIEKEFGNQYIKAKKLGLPKPEMTQETRNKISKSNIGKKLSEEHKEKLSISMQRAVRENPESYSGSNVNGRSKKSTYKGFSMDSNWELEFGKWCDKNHISWEKAKEGFEYEWNGKRVYYPDFYLKDLDLYVEVKGYERERDRIKWKAIKNLAVVKVKEITKIKYYQFNINDLLSCIGSHS